MPEGITGSKSFNDNQIISSEDLKKLSWQQFEALTVEVMSKELNADSAWLASNGADKGSDGVLLVNNKLVLIQSKHTIRGTFDGYKAIQEIVGAKPVYESEMVKETKSLLFVTNASILSKRTREVAKQCGVEVINGKSFSEKIEKHSITFKEMMTRLNKKRLKV